MIEYKDRLLHCHKVRYNVKIFEDYEVTQSSRTLVHRSCSGLTHTDVRKRCNGLDEWNNPCPYAHLNTE